MATWLAIEEARKEDCPWQEMVPREYHHYGIVFSNEAAQQFLAKCPWDHAIELVPDAPATLDCKIYPLSLGQQPA